MKIFSKFLILLLTVVSVFSIKNVSADTPDIVIKDMSISEKSDTIIVNDYGFSGTTMNSDVTFYDIGDYVTYKVVLKNNTNNTYSINGLTDNNENSNVTYEYNSNEEKVLEANKELDIYITVKYTTELAPGETSVSTGSIDIVLDMSEVKNPNTSDNIIMLFIMLTLSALSVILIKNKKAKYLTVIAISLGLIIPTVLAKETFKLTINSTCNVVKTATFKAGRDVNYQMKVLAGMPDDYTWQWYDNEFGSGYSIADSNNIGYWDHNITSVEKASNDYYEEVKDELTEEYIVSTEDSKYPIYMWYGDGVIYYYSEANKLYLNSDASYMFYDLESVTSIDTSSFDTRKVTNISYMFNWCGSLTELDVSGFDTSEVTDMSFMFDGCWGLTSLNVNEFDVSKVTNMSRMFYDTNRNYINESIISEWTIKDDCDTTEMFGVGVVE